MTDYTVRSGHNWISWFDENVLHTVSPHHFDPAYWQERSAVTGTAGGRRTAYFIHPKENAKDEQCRLVLRHYYRGGLIGRINEDAFWGIRVENSRAMREFALLNWMRQQQLPVPRPVAALFTRSGLYYRSDILIEQLPCDGDLFTVLKSEPLQPAQWHQLGALIQSFHAKGIFHSDLNCHNILIRQHNGQTWFWLIDFDKCERRQPGSWQTQNLQRLQRSLNKESQAHPAFHFEEKAWTALMDGYHET